ncbi:MAG: HAD hydrolase-like protein [Chloroflexi bacterium]|nr:HAD hydrolase-like protein [Chloroflexota bacterium]
MTILVFDWGNTLMRVFPEYTGPMVHWPEVALIRGADDALASLSGQYRMVVATNARESSTEQVRAALQRVDIDRYFEQVFTTHNLKQSCKPDPEFFKAIETQLSADSADLLMIGDDYCTDVLGAVQCGWQAAWFNPNHESAASLTPLHRIEIDSFAHLPAALSRPALPSVPTCLGWLQEEGSSSLLLIHVQLVAAIAYQLAIWLRANGQAVDPILAHRGGLLHDLAKLLSLRTGASSDDHGRLAARLLTQREQPELAEIAYRHLLFCLIDEDRRPQTWEQKIVYFADKLVEKSQLASLDERLQGLRERYPHHQQQIDAIIPALLELQDEICLATDILPSELLPCLNNALLGEE